jgi:hypothetical protein
MERGEIQSDEKAIVEPCVRSADSRKPDDEGSSGTTLGGQEQEDQLPSRAGGERARPDTPPDGTDLVTEWQEPHHRIIERRTRPGEDVRFAYALQRSVRIDSLLLRLMSKLWTRRIPCALADHIFDKHLAIR